MIIAFKYTTHLLYTYTYVYKDKCLFVHYVHKSSFQFRTTKFSSNFKLKTMHLHLRANILQFSMNKNKLYIIFRP